MSILRIVIRLALFMVLAVLVTRLGVGHVVAQTAQPTPQPRFPKSAFVTVVQRPEPNVSVRPGDIVTSTIVVVNRGEGSARQVTLNVPFDPAQVSVLDVQFSRAGAWVSALLADMLVIQTGRLDAGGDTVTATLRLATLPGLADGTSLGKRISYTWNDDADDGTGRSNLPALVVGDQSRQQPWYPLAVNRVNRAAGVAYVFSSDIFAPREPVTFWYNTPTGQVVELGPIDNDANGIVIASEDGVATLQLSTTGLAPGTYSMVAYGNWTAFTAVGIFQVP